MDLNFVVLQVYLVLFTSSSRSSQHKLNLIKLIKPSSTTLGESQVTRYSVKLPERHVSVCRDHHQVLRAKDGRDRPKHVVLVIL